eukprot:TRINITY_DN12460_c0_g1_i1.p1 TRINITY_DN12460_c0_g1~~TRINITY_DN12460_c0_g1_i1.p1  ORF type:complete len:156 (-),score=14.78 TRINITY_DN12460_c0_g1_i1:221-688(-)
MKGVVLVTLLCLMQGFAIRVGDRSEAEVDVALKSEVDAHEMMHRGHAEAKAKSQTSEDEIASEETETDSTRQRCACCKGGGHGKDDGFYAYVCSRRDYSPGDLCLRWIKLKIDPLRGTKTSKYNSDGRVKDSIFDPLFGNKCMENGQIVVEEVEV